MIAAHSGHRRPCKPVLILALLLATPLIGACDTDPDAAEARPGVERGAASASAPTRGSGDGKVEELAEYELTMPALRRFAEAAGELDRLSASHPQLEEGMDADQVSLDAVERQIASVPAARKAIEDAGLSTREYVVIGFVLMQAGFAQMAEQSGTSAEAFAEEAGINPANIAFMKDHEAEVRRIFAGLGGAADDEDGG